MGRSSKTITVSTDEMKGVEICDEYQLPDGDELSWWVVDSIVVDNDENKKVITLIPKKKGE